MMLQIGDQWLNTDAMKALYLDTNSDGQDYAVVTWRDARGPVEIAENEVFNLHLGQMAAIEAALGRQIQIGR